MMSQTTPPRPTNVTATIPYYSGPSPADPTDNLPLKSTILQSARRFIQIKDIRPSISHYTLSTHGFCVTPHASLLLSPPYTRASWKFRSLREDIHSPEIEELVKRVTGCRKVMILGGSARTEVHKEPSAMSGEEMQGKRGAKYPAYVADGPRVKGFEPGTEQGPAVKPHIDFSPRGARATLRNWRQDIADEAADIIAAEGVASQLPGGIEANYNGRRWALLGTWRPLKTVTRDPLAYVAFSSMCMKGEDLVPYVLSPPGIHGNYETDILLARVKDSHEWYWCSDQKPDEVTFLKFFDSESEKGNGVAGGIPHCSFHLEGTEGEPARESLEVRVVAFW